MQQLRSVHPVLMDVVSTLQWRVPTAYLRRVTLGHGLKTLQRLSCWQGFAAGHFRRWLRPNARSYAHDRALRRARRPWIRSGSGRRARTARPGVTVLGGSMFFKDTDRVAEDDAAARHRIGVRRRVRPAVQPHTRGGPGGQVLRVCLSGHKIL